MAAADPVTAVYRQRLAAGRAGLLAMIAAAFAAVFDPRQPFTSLAALGGAAGSWTAAAQNAAITETQLWLQAMLSAAAREPLERVPPPELRRDRVGSSASGRPLTDMTGQAPAVYAARREQGWTEDAAAAASHAWLNSLGASEPSRIANAAALDAVGDDDRFLRRYQRITAPGACPFCETIADRGYIPYHEGVTFAAHRNCRCTAGPAVATEFINRAAAIRRAQRYGLRERAAEFALTGDWAQDLLAIRGLDTSDWFRSTSTLGDRIDQLARVREVGQTIENEAQRRYLRALQGLAIIPSPQESALMLIDARRDVMSEIRPMGGRLDTRSRGAGVQAIRWASQFYPREWLEGMNRYGDWRIKTTARGFFQRYGRVIAISGTGQGARNTAVHELGHGAQFSRSQILNAEALYHQLRTTRPDGSREPMAGISGPSLPKETGRRDLYPRAYSGREYGGDYYEVLTTTAESVFGTGRYADASMRQFMLGVWGLL